MPGEYTMKVDLNVTPVIHAPRQIPLSLQDKVKAELDKMEAIGVIIVRQDQPTPWINTMVLPIKSNGKVWICIDTLDVNKAILREHFPLRTVDESEMQVCLQNSIQHLDFGNSNLMNRVPSYALLTHLLKGTVLPECPLESNLPRMLTSNLGYGQEH